MEFALLVSLVRHHARLKTARPQVGPARSTLVMKVDEAFGPAVRADSALHGRQTACHKILTSAARKQDMTVLRVAAKSVTQPYDAKIITIRQRRFRHRSYRFYKYFKPVA
jgi:hypothetical protein